MNRVRWTVMTACVVGGGWLAAMAPPAAGACLTGSVTFTFTGAEQCYVVPAGVDALAVTAIGGKGGDGDAAVYGQARARAGQVHDRRMTVWEETLR